MDLLRKMGCTMACVLVLVASAVPAAAADNLDVPVWYGGAVKAFDRMGSTSLQLPWWISKGTAKKILQLKDDRTFDIDAKLDDQGVRDGYPAQKDFDQALDDHASVIRYQDKTFEMREWLNLLGQTFADGYAASANGSKVYGDTGYIPTSEEIDQESQKLAHTSSYLLQQAKNFDYDASSAQAETSGCRAVAKVFSAVDYAWKRGGDTPGTYLASDVIPYDPSQFKNYDALTVLDRDNGTLYYDQVLNEMSGKKSSIVNYSDLKPSAVVGGRKAQAKQWAGKAKELGKEAGKQGLLGMIDQFVGGMIQDGSRKVLDMTVGLDNWCETLTGLTAGNWALKALGYIDNKVVGTVTGVDCDNYVPQGTAVSTRQFGKAKKDLSGEQSMTDDKAPHWSWTWTPWYVATDRGVSMYIRGKWYTDGNGGNFIWITDLRCSSIHSSGEYPGFVLGSEAVDEDGSSSVMYMNNNNKYYGWGYEGMYAAVAKASYKSDYKQLSTSSNSTDLGWYDAFPGDPDTAFGTLRYTLTKAWPWSSAFPSAAPFSRCGDDCPAAYRPQQNIQDLTTTTTVTDQDGTQHISSLDGQDLDNGGLFPRHVQAGLNDDGTIGGTLSYGATANGKTSDLGSMSLDGIKPNPTGKRLDLIDTVTGKSCFSEGYACADWVKETQTLVPEHQLDVNFKGTTKEYPNLKYKCSYDVPGKITEVPLGECIAYAPQFKPEAQKSGQTTGQPDGSTSDKTTTKPDTSYSWNDCVKSATSETAAAWLYSPITCAAHQLFIPDTKVMTTTAVKFQRDTSDGIMPQFQELRTNWGALFDSFGGGCHGIKVNFSWGDIKVFDDAEFLNACPGTQLEFLPTLAKAGITLGLAVMAFSICRKAVMAIFDFNIPDGGGDA